MLPHDDTGTGDASTGPNAVSRSAYPWEIAALPVLLIVWLLCHPYFGNNRGSLIYTARALADLDPGGVGADAMFRFDGQSGFTIFTPVLRILTSMLGASVAGMTVALAATFLYFAAATTLAWRLAEGRTRYLIVMFMAVLPAFYGGYRIFSYAEASATPRPFAEALVLFALAALLARRRALALVCIGIAALIHPIMALAGAAVVLIVLAVEDRRWIVAIAGAIAVGLIAAALGVPPFDRAFVVIDPEWLAILRERNPHLFPSMWLAGSIGGKAARIAALLIAASVVAPRARTLLLAVAAVGPAGLLASWLLGDKLPLLLVAQAQVWRMMWLTHAVSGAALAICVVELWKRDNAARLSLLFLALAIVYGSSDMAGVAFAATALALRFALDPKDDLISARGFRIACALIMAFLVAGMAQSQWQTYNLLAHAPADVVEELRRTLTVSYDFAPFALIAAAWTLSPRRFPSRLGVTALCIGGVALLFVSWDRRSAESRLTDSSGPQADLVSLTAARPGEIYWINGVRESWTWLGRPNWVSAVQGAGIVFSRELALLYRERAQRVIGLKLADDEIVTPLTEPHLREIPPLDHARVARLCISPDAPAWIVAPLVGDERISANLSAKIWTAPVEKVEVLDRDGQIGWRRLSRYAIIPCRAETANLQ